MALKDRPIRGGQLDPVIIAGLVDSDGDINDATSLPMSEVWRIRTISDTDLNDSNKTITVPAGQEWQVLWIYAILATTADVGNRQMTLEIESSGGINLAVVKAGAVQAASLTRYYLFAPAMADLLAFRDTSYLMTPIPPTLFLDAGQVIRVLDSAAIAAAGDDLTLYLQVAWRSV